MFVFYFIELMITPILMVMIGMSWRNNPPKTINKVYGYRTTRSMKSKESWEFAHRYFGRILFKLVLVITVLTIVILLIFKNSNDNTLVKVVLIILMIQVIAFILPVIPTEIALKRNFGK